MKRDDSPGSLVIRGELRGERCSCGRPLQEAPDVQRERVRYRSGPARGMEGTALVVSCSCGLSSLVALTAA